MRVFNQSNKSAGNKSGWYVVLGVKTPLSCVEPWPDMLVLGRGVRFGFIGIPPFVLN